MGSYFAARSFLSFKNEIFQPSEMAQISMVWRMMVKNFTMKYGEFLGVENFQ